MATLYRMGGDPRARRMGWRMRTLIVAGLTAGLLAEQARIRAEEFRYRHSGGGLSPREYLDLQRDLNRASRHIYRQKHDAQLGRLPD